MSVQKQGSEHHRIKELGRRPGQIRLSDARSRDFKEEARRQASLVAIQNREFDDQDFVEAVSVEWGDE
ncbi:antitoxin MazE-like protein [Luteococcus sediminum]